MDEEPEEELVTLTVVTDNNHVPFAGLTTKTAQNIMAAWLESKAHARKVEGGQTDEESLKQHLAYKHGVIANFCPSDGDEAPSAVAALSSIVGMYLIEHDDSLNDLRDSHAVEAEELQFEMLKMQVELTRMQLKKMKKEDSWQGEEE